MGARETRIIRFFQSVAKRNFGETTPAWQESCKNIFVKQSSSLQQNKFNIIYGCFSNESAFCSRNDPYAQGAFSTSPPSSPARGEEARLGNDWRLRIAKSTLSIHAFFLKEPSSIKRKMQLGKKSYY